MKHMNTVVCGLTIMLLFPLTCMICCGDESETSSSVAFYPTGKEPPPLKQKDAKPERLTQSKNMKGATLVDYTIQVTIDTYDGEISGSSKYIPRIRITAKNNPLPKSCLLVIEYYSKLSSSQSKSRKECVEHISLPDIGKGESVTVDANGIKLRMMSDRFKRRSDGKTVVVRGEQELCGVIVSLFQDDKLLIQMCSQQLLAKECTDTIPAPQAYEYHP